MQERVGTRVGAVLMLGAVALACGSAPIGSALFGSSLQQQGAELAAQLHEHGMLLEDDTLSDYVSAVGDRLAKLADRSPVDAFHFAVLDMPEPNAFALPIGHLYVSRGMLVLLNSEDELAGTLGHEIGHVLARHHVKQAARDVPLKPFRLVTRISGGIVGLVLPGLGRAMSGAGDLTSALAHAPYSRSQESEADRIGQELAARAGWDPEGISRVMDALAAEQRLHGSDPNRQFFLATHPTSPERSARTRKQAASIVRAEPHPIAATRLAFLDRLDGLVVGDKAADGVFDGPDFLHPGLDFALAFPAGEGWVRVNDASAVGTLREDSRAAVVLEIVAEADDALEVARSFEPGDGGPRCTPRSRDRERPARRSGPRQRRPWQAFNSGRAVVDRARRTRLPTDRRERQHRVRGAGSALRNECAKLPTTRRRRPRAHRGGSSTPARGTRG